MYEENSIFKQPEDDNVRVWRYMDFTKLVSLIESKHLFFTRADKFDDPFEGSWPKMNVNARNKIPPLIAKKDHEKYLKGMSRFGDSNKIWRKQVAINCWHKNDHESAAMWKLYLKSNEGVAIQSTYLKLRESITDDENVYLGIVEYIDYEKEWINDGRRGSPYVYKRKSFEHEQEIRAIVLKHPRIGKNGGIIDSETINHGVKIKVDIEQLIENIYVAPSAPDWFSDLVSAIVQHYGYNFNVVRSKLDGRPLF